MNRDDHSNNTSYRSPQAWEDLKLVEEAILSLIEDGELDDLTTYQRVDLVDELAGVAVRIARYIDKVKGVDPDRCYGPCPRLGTHNHRSMTYKMRKLLNYSYP